MGIIKTALKLTAPLWVTAGVAVSGHVAKEGMPDSPQEVARMAGDVREDARRTVGDVVEFSEEFIEDAGVFVGEEIVPRAQAASEFVQEEVAPAVRDAGVQIQDVIGGDAEVEPPSDTPIQDMIMRSSNLEEGHSEYQEVLDGAQFIQSALNETYIRLAEIPSRSFRGRSIAEVVPPELLVQLFIVENMNHHGIENNRKLLRSRFNNIISRVGNEGDRVYAGTVSPRGASGAMQIMPGMYTSVRRLYSLNGDIPERHVVGTASFEDSLLVAACLLDDLLMSMRNYGHIDADDPSQISRREMREWAVTYNSGAVIYHNNRHSLPEEAQQYRRTYREVAGLTGSTSLASL